MKTMSIYREASVENQGDTAGRWYSGNLAPTFLILMVTSYLVTPPPAHAHLDPGTGRYVIQLTYAGWLGAAYVGSVYLGRVDDFFKIKFLRGRRHG